MSTVLCTSERLAKPLGYVYILACAGGRFYVGFSKNVLKRVHQHFTGEGAIFTKMFPPSCVLETVPANGEADEYKVWKDYVKRYGRRRVGGWNEALAKSFGFVWKQYE